MPDMPDGPGLTMLPRGAAGSPAVPAAARPGLARRGWASARGRLYGPARKVLRACAARPGAAGAVVLAAWYLWCYLGDRSLPGNDLRQPLGWWDWWDQGKYIESARALAAGALSPDRHWYPLGYSLMGAPFTRWSQGHPMLPVNLASLLLCYAGFLAFARRVGVGRGWAAALFLVAAAGSRMLFEGWIVPWSTTPAAALIWLLLATAAGHMQGARRPFLVGLLAAAIPLVRPTELVLAVPCVLAVIASDLWRPPARGQLAGSGRPEDGNLRGGWARARRVRDLGLLALGGLLAVVPYGLLHWRIYGLGPSPYMAMSTGVGFTLHDFGWKAYTVLSDPRAWFLDGRGLLWRAPYAALAVAGLAVAWAHGRAAVLLAALTVVHSVLYLFLRGPAADGAVAVLQRALLAMGAARPGGAGLLGGAGPAAVAPGAAVPAGARGGGGVAAAAVRAGGAGRGGGGGAGKDAGLRRAATGVRRGVLHRACAAGQHGGDARLRRAAGHPGAGGDAGLCAAPVLWRRSGLGGAAAGLGGRCGAGALWHGVAAGGAVLDAACGLQEAGAELPAAGAGVLGHDGTLEGAAPFGMTPGQAGSGMVSGLTPALTDLAVPQSAVPGSAIPATRCLPGFHRSADASTRCHDSSASGAVSTMQAMIG